MKPTIYSVTNFYVFFPQMKTTKEKTDLFQIVFYVIYHIISSSKMPNYVCQMMKRDRCSVHSCVLPDISTVEKPAVIFCGGAYLITFYIYYFCYYNYIITYQYNLVAKMTKVTMLSVELN